MPSLDSFAGQPATTAAQPSLDSFVGSSGQPNNTLDSFAALSRQPIPQAAASAASSIFSGKPSFPSSPGDGVLTTTAKTLGNIPSDAGGMVGDTFKSLAAIPGAALDLAQNDPHPLKDLGSGFLDVIGHIGTSLYGDAKTFLTHLQQDPAGTITNLATSAAQTAVNHPLSTALTFDTGAGALEKGGISATATPIIDKAGDISQAISQPIAKAATDATDGASATLMDKVARINPSDAETFSHFSGGQTPGQFLDARGIYGSTSDVVSKLLDNFTQAKQAVDTTLAKLPGLYQNQAVDTALQNVVKNAAETSAPGADSPYLAKATDLLDKSQTTGLTMSEVNDAKRLYEGTVKLNYIKDGVSSGIERANNIDSAIRTWQQETAYKLGFTNIRALNKETQLSKMLIDSLGKKANAQIGNNFVGLTDAIMASGIPHSPASVAALLAKKITDSSAVKGQAASLLSRGAKMGTPTAEMGEMNLSPDVLGLPGAGEGTKASNLPPVVHGKAGGLFEADKQGAKYRTTDTSGSSR